MTTMTRAEQESGLTVEQMPGVIRALLHEADDEGYWLAKSYPELLHAAEVFAEHGTDEHGLIRDPETGRVLNPPPGREG